MSPLALLRLLWTRKQEPTVPEKSATQLKEGEQGWPPLTPVHVVAVPAWLARTLTTGILAAVGLLVWIGIETHNIRVATDQLSATVALKGAVWPR